MSWIIDKKTKKYGPVFPKATHWTEDDNKFGKKLMERMGWSSGKGLGANENGSMETVAMRVKNDKIGLGSTKQSADQWLAHQDDFNSLLATLNSGSKDPSAANSASNSDGEDRVQSLEKKSESTRKRVHYKKFTKGKDLSQGKGEDLDCIFGRRKLKSETKDKPASEPTSTVQSRAVSDEEKEGVKHVTSELSVQAYFAQKMAALQAKRQDDSQQKSKKKKNKKRKKDERDFDEETDEPEAKKRKQTEKSEINTNVDRLIENSTETKENTSDMVVDKIEDETVPVKDKSKKKKKRKRKEKESESRLENETESETEQQQMKVEEQEDMKEEDGQTKTKQTGPIDLIPNFEKKKKKKKDKSIKSDREVRIKKLQTTQVGKEIKVKNVTEQVASELAAGLPRCGHPAVMTSKELGFAGSNLARVPGYQFSRPETMFVKRNKNRY